MRFFFVFNTLITRFSLEASYQVSMQNVILHIFICFLFTLKIVEKYYVTRGLNNLRYLKHPTYSPYNISRLKKITTKELSSAIESGISSPCIFCFFQEIFFCIFIFSQTMYAQKLQVSSYLCEKTFVKNNLVIRNEC